MDGDASSDHAQEQYDRVKAAIMRSLQQLKYYMQGDMILRISVGGASNLDHHGRLIERYKQQLSALIQVYKLCENYSKFDIVCKYLTQREYIDLQMKSTSQQSTVEDVPNKQIVASYGTPTQLRNMNNAKIIQTKIVGIKHKSMPMEHFVQLQTQYREKMTNQNLLQKKQGVFLPHHKHIIEQRKRQALQEYPELDMNRNPRVRKRSKQIKVSDLSSDIEEITPPIKQQIHQRDVKHIIGSTKTTAQNKRTAISKQQAQSNSKRKLQLISGSQGSNEDQAKNEKIQQQQNNKLRQKVLKLMQIQQQRQRIQQQVQFGDNKRKDVKNNRKREIKSKRSKNTKMKQKSIEHLVRIEQANNSEQISNKKETQKRKKKSGNNSLSKNKKKTSKSKSKSKEKKQVIATIENPLSFMNKKMQIGPNKDSVDQGIQQSMDEKKSDKAIVNSHANTYEFGIKSTQECNERKNLREYRNSPKNSNKGILNKIVKQTDHIKEKLQQKKEMIQIQQNQDKIMRSLSVTASNCTKKQNNIGQTSTQSPKATKIDNNIKQKSNEKKNKNSKKRLPKIPPQNNMTLDQFFKKL